MGWRFRTALLIPLLLGHAASASESEFYATDDCENGLVYVLEDGVVKAVLTGTYNEDVSCDADQHEFVRDYDDDAYVENLYCCFDGADTWPASTYTIIEDIDGFVDLDLADRGDCDDDDNNVYPNAAEVCDGVLNDCPTDGSSTATPDDEADEDGDGYVACTAWVGTDEAIIDGDDCDDTNDEVYPGAEEICDGELNDCEDSRGLDSEETDDDGDGYVDCDEWKGNDRDIEDGADCDDADPTAYPGAEELCDGVLNDCTGDGVPDDEIDDDGDGYVDCDTWEGLASLGAGDCDDTNEDTYPGAAEFEPTLCTPDADDDGYGDSLATGEVDAGTDCDDDDADTHPYTAEVCEDDYQIDSDCDGSVNTTGCYEDDMSGCSVVEDGIVTAYADEDGDGYAASDATDLVIVCARVDGYSEKRTDCDDDDDSINIEATEQCGDGADNNCDGQSDEANASGCSTMFRDLDSDGYGDYDVSACLCAQDDGDGSLDGEAYVVQGGDCDDGSDLTHPVSCADELDNDGDGLTDADDPDCQVTPALSEDGFTREAALERLDGNDNDCDGDLPAIELDCDDDGALPSLPIQRTVVETSDQVGLTSCGEPDATTTITCWGIELSLTCDLDENGGGSGLWVLAYSEDDDGYEGRYDRGARVYEDLGDITVVGGDCDDQCASRSPALTESCDGLDNDCSGTTGADQDGDGLPDASQTDDEPVAGLVSAVEVDLDQDGYLPCDDFDEDDDEVYSITASCSDIVTDEALLTDCSNRCNLALPGAEERCDGFTNACDGEDEIVDEDDDGYGTCGAWGTDGIEDGEEDIYVLVWMRTDSDRTSTVTLPDTTTDTGDTDADSADTADTATSTTTQLADYVPLIPPRETAAECDQQLTEQLAQLVDLDALYTGLEEDDPTALLEACTDHGGTCAIVRLTLTPSIDDDTATDWLPEAIDRDFVSYSCRQHADQQASRNVWSRERILAARTLVLEWECERQFGKSCAEAAESPSLADGWDTMADATDALTSAAWWWWIEIDRFNPVAISEGTIGECWGSSDEYDSDTQATGGDCDDSAAGVNRGVSEGPYDVLATLSGEEVDCSQCTDGLDNNCDGLLDCDDPTCSVCFVGVGTGCGGEGTCSTGGCATGADKRAKEAALPLWGLLALAAARIRRKHSTR